MGLVYTGNSKSLNVIVTKSIDGVPQTPVTYPTATDIGNGSFTYTGGTVVIPTPAALAQMSTVDYDNLLTAFQTYVEESESGLDFLTATIVAPAIITGDVGCPVAGTPVTTTTTSTTTSTSTTTAAPTTTSAPYYEYSITLTNSALGCNDLTATLVYAGPEQGNPMNVTHFFTTSDLFDKFIPVGPVTVGYKLGGIGNATHQANMDAAGDMTANFTC